MSASTQPSGSFLLDTNIVIAIFAAEQAVLTRLGGASAVFVPIIVIGELFFGAYNSTRVQANLARVQQFAATSSLLQPDIATAQHYGQLKAELRALGRPLPENDVWIAAQARQYGLTLVSRDAHFQVVPHLTTEVW